MKKERKKTIDQDESLPSVPEIVRRDAEAIAEWERIIPELQKTGSLTKVDRAILAGYCLNYAKIERLESYLHKNKMTVRVGRQGYSQVRPEVAILRECWKLMRTFADQLGLSPNSRKKLGVMDPDGDDSFFDDDGK